MKKLITSLFVAALMTVGLVTVSGGTAAHAARPGYNAAPPVFTVTHPNLKHVGKKANATASLFGGRAAVTGTITLNLRGPGKNFHSVKATSGSPVKFAFGKLKKIGRYRITASFFSSSAAYTDLGTRGFGFIRTSNKKVK